LDNQPNKRPSPAEVVKRVEEWLDDPANVESLKQAFARADKLSKELSERTRLPVNRPNITRRCRVSFLSLRNTDFGRAKNLAV